MAGDWIKVQSALPDKPEVWQVSHITGIEPDAVVGKLVRVWIWFDAHTTDGNAVGVTFALLDSVAGATGFGEAMANSGWLTVNDDGLSLPNFDRHNGETAKSRALGAKRAAKRRARSDSNAGSVTKSAQSNADSVTKSAPREEKRREEKYKNTPLPPAKPGGLCGDNPETASLASEEKAKASTDLPASIAPIAQSTPNSGKDAAGAEIALNAKYGDLATGGASVEFEHIQIPHFNEFATAWRAEKLPGHDLPNGITATNGRRGLWQARFRDRSVLYDGKPWCDLWREALARAGRSKKCCGHAGSWKLTPEMVLNNHEFITRILEGQFDDSPATIPFKAKRERDPNLPDVFAEVHQRRKGGAA